MQRPASGAPPRRPHRGVGGGRQDPEAHAALGWAFQHRRGPQALPRVGGGRPRPATMSWRTPIDGAVTPDTRIRALGGMVPAIKGGRAHPSGRVAPNRAHAPDPTASGRARDPRARGPPLRPCQGSSCGARAVPVRGGARGRSSGHGSSHLTLEPARAPQGRVAASRGRHDGGPRLRQAGTDCVPWGIPSTLK